MLAEVDDEQPVGDRQQRVHHVLDPDHRHALRLDALQLVHQLARLVLGQPAGDLVEQQQLRPRGQRARQLEPLAVQQGQRRRRGWLACAQQAGLLEHLAARCRQASRSRWPPPKQAAATRFSNTVIVAERLRDLVGAADAERGSAGAAERGDVAAVELDAAGVGAHVAADQVEQRRLARAVGPEDAQRLAALTASEMSSVTFSAP